MLPQVVTSLVCLSPLLFLFAGFYVGRYGSPIVLRFRKPRRVTPVTLDSLNDEEESEE